MSKDLVPEDSMKEMLIKQPYAVTVARHRLSVTELRIFVKILEALQSRMRYDKDLGRYLKPFEVAKTDLGDIQISLHAKELIVDGSKNHKHLRIALIGLTKKGIAITTKEENGEEVEVFTNIVMRSSFRKRANLVRLDIPKEIVPELIGLANNYTKYLVEVAFKSASANTIRLYQYISHWRDKKQVFLTVDSIRKWLELDAKYAKPAHLARRILEPAMKTLKEEADVWFDIAQRVMHPDNKRRMLGWKFNIYTKDQPSHKTSTQIKTKRAKTKTEQSLIDIYKLSEKQAEKVFKKIRTEEEKKKVHELLYDIQLAIINKKISTSVGGYTTAILNEHFPHLKL